MPSFAHSALDPGLCAALTTLQFQANGDVTVCAFEPPVGNIKAAPIRQIWAQRPCYWQEGCCIPRRSSEQEKKLMALTQGRS